MEPPDVLYVSSDKYSLSMDKQVDEGNVDYLSIRLSVAFIGIGLSQQALRTTRN